MQIHAAYSINFNISFIKLARKVQCNGYGINTVCININRNETKIKLSVH